MKRPTPPTRSLTEVPGWIPKTCERCDRQFWSVPSQFKYTRFCTATCRYESPEQVIEKTTTKCDGDACWICSLAPSSDYPHIKIKGVSMRVCRFVLENKLGRPICEGLMALHSCNNPRCVRPEHIREGTQSENIKQCVEQHRQVGNRVLTDEQVREIRLLKGKMTAPEVAKLYGMKPPSIYNIWLGYNRGDVSP